MSLNLPSPSFTFKNLYDEWTNLVNYFNDKEIVIESFPNVMDTSSFSTGLFGYLDSSGDVQLAFATNTAYYSDFFIVESAVEGKVIQFGVAYSAEVEDNIDIIAGEYLYLTEDSSDPGKVTNVPTAQYLGKALNDSTSTGGTVDIWYKTADSNATLTATDEYIAGTDYVKNTTNQLTISNVPTTEDNISIYFDGVFQQHTTFSLTNDVVTFVSAIPADNVEIVTRYTENYHRLTPEISAESVDSPAFVNDMMKAISDITAEANKLIEITGTGPNDAQLITKESLRPNVINQEISVISTNTTASKFKTYILNGSLTLTLPSSPSSGDWVKYSDISDTGTCIIARNGSNIMSLSEDLTLNIKSTNFTLVYTDVTNGWVLV